MKNLLIYFVRMTFTATLIYLSYLETGMFTLFSFILITSGFEALAFHLNKQNKKIKQLQNRLFRLENPMPQHPNCRSVTNFDLEA